MKTKVGIILLRKILICFIYLIYSATSGLAQTKGWEEVEKVFGKQGSVQDGVLKITYPRTDLKVNVGDFSIEPGLALTSWIGFLKTNTDGDMPGDAMIMGDLVLLEKEVAPVISKLLSENIQITALHNHLIGETPIIKYLHFSGRGDAVKLAESLKSVISVTSTPFTSVTQTQKDNPDWSKIEAVLGKGKHNTNLLQYAFPRLEKVTESGMEIPPYMGVATGINFQIDGDRAAVTGDFVLLAEEVNPVIRALTQNGIAVTALHNHMLYDNPRLFMMHFWGVNSPEKLALGIKAALDKTNSKK